MAEGLFIRVTNAASEGESVLLTDVYDATDGAAHELNRAGNVYVPTESSVDLAYTGDVARSFENGCIRGMINAGTLTASFGRGEAAGETVAYQVENGVALGCAALGKVVGISIATTGALHGDAEINISQNGGDQLVANEGVGGLDGTASLTIEEDVQADTEVGDAILIELTSIGGVQTATIQITFASVDA
tara:strand:- start:567 stop:1136 length:570 start_codon:yes stop_codon:yes gene_type:complete